MATPPTNIPRNKLAIMCPLSSFDANINSIIEKVVTKVMKKAMMANKNSDKFIKVYK